MGMGGGSAKPSFTFNDKDALALNQQNAQQLQAYQLQRQKAVAGQNKAMTGYFNKTNMLAQDNLLQNMGMYTNALGGYQQSLNQNTADAQGLMNSQQQYYNAVLDGQQQYQNSFGSLMGNYNQNMAAQNAQYQQEYLNQLGGYNADTTAQQQQFMSAYMGQLADYDLQNQQVQQEYRDKFRATKNDFSSMKQNVAANQAQVNQQASQQGLMQLLQQFGSNPQQWQQNQAAAQNFGAPFNPMFSGAYQQIAQAPSNAPQLINQNNKVQRRR